MMDMVWVTGFRLRLVSTLQRSCKEKALVVCRGQRARCLFAPVKKLAFSTGFCNRQTEIYTGFFDEIGAQTRRLYLDQMIIEADRRVHSPLSLVPPKKIRDLPASFLLEKLGAYYQATPPPKVVETDYALWECAETKLQFAWPPIPGNASFYEWISHFESYYPGFRWEYGQAARHIKNLDYGNPGFKILDVGSGKGDFLKALDFLPAQNRFALDLNKPAIEACQAQGFRAFCGTIESAIAAGFFRPNEFAVVSSFHCLEHVSQPVEFVRELLRATTSGGRVFLSTPYSPMSFEDGWFDVLNHPPHHMTRWNLRSYQKLAEILGVQFRHYAPPNRPVKQALQAFGLRHYPPHARVSRTRRLKDLLLHAPQFLGDWHHASTRAASHDNGGSDLILVEFILP